jgi:ankyrin repeat domain-containing protein 50
MFMGTPHRGSDIAAAVKPLSRLVNYGLSLSGTSIMTGLMRTDLFMLLSRESTQLGDINESFVHRLENIVIMSCFETEIPRGMQHLVVKQSSAILGIQNEQQIPVSADHMTICRFASRSESKYKNVSSALLRIAQVIIELKHNSAIGMGGARSPNQCMNAPRTTDT